MPEITIGSNDYPVFADVDVADAYLAADVSRAAGWATRNADAKARGLVSATRMLLGLPWCDTAPDPTAAQDAQISPVPEVTAQLAADLLAKPKLFADASGSSNVKSVKAGSVAVDFFTPVSGGPPIPKSLWNQLVAAGLICPDVISGMAGAEFSGQGDCRPFEGRYPWDWPIACEDYD